MQRAIVQQVLRVYRQNYLDNLNRRALISADILSHWDCEQITRHQFNVFTGFRPFWVLKTFSVWFFFMNRLSGAAVRLKPPGLYMARNKYDWSHYKMAPQDKEIHARASQWLSWWCVLRGVSLPIRQRTVINFPSTQTARDAALACDWLKHLFWRRGLCDRSNFKGTGLGQGAEWMRPKRAGLRLWGTVHCLTVCNERLSAWFECVNRIKLAAFEG